MPAEFRYDTAPNTQRFQPPVWPWIDGLPVRDGMADVFFAIDSQGRVNQVRIVSATSDAFGKAAQAAVERWQFTPAKLDGKPVPALGRRDVQFKLYLPKDASELRLSDAIKAGKTNYAKAEDLDAALKPFVLVPAQYPMALAHEGLSGSAVIECIIDQDGRVCLPRIVEASRDEFGWAAATAVSQVRFNQPTVKGRPVDVKVRIPFEFGGAAKAAE